MKHWKSGHPSSIKNATTTAPCSNCSIWNLLLARKPLKCMENILKTVVVWKFEPGWIFFFLSCWNRSGIPPDPREVATEKILQHILRQFVWIKSNCSRWLKWVYVCCNNYSILSLLFTYVLRREFKSEKYKQGRQQKIILPSWVELNVPKLSDQGLHKRQSSLL